MAAPMSEGRQRMRQRKPSSDEVEISVVLPCLNEQESVASCVREARAACVASGLGVEVIVADNNSTDESATVARAAGARVIEAPTPGYGSALQAGIAAARGAVVVMADADATYPLDRIPELAAPVLSGSADLVVGSRLSGATLRNMPLLHRVVGTPAITMLLRQGTGGLAVRDSQSGFRAICREKVEALGLTSTGMEFASEMLIRAMQGGLVVRELPLGYRERIGESKLNAWRDGLRHVSLINRLSPHAFLWYLGLAALLLGVMAQLLTVVTGSAISIGSAAWQPVFFGPTAQVIGVCAVLVAGVLAQHGPGSTEATRRGFAWIRDRRFIVSAGWAGLMFLIMGIAIDIALWFARSSSSATYQKVTLAGLAQSALLTGCVLGLFSVLYRTVGLDRRSVAMEEEPPKVDRI